MADKTDDVLSGAIGFFWPQRDMRLTLDDDDALRGYVHRNEDGLVEVRVLNEDPLSSELLDRDAPPPKAIFGMTERTGILVTDIVRTASTLNLGGSRASVQRFMAHAVLSSVWLDRAQGSRLSEVSAYFDDGLIWAGRSVLEESYTLDENNLFKTVTFTLTSEEKELAGGTLGPFQLTLAPRWETSGNGASRTIRASLEVGLTARRPRALQDFIDKLAGVQDLLCMAFDRFVVGRGGRARIEGYQGSDEPSYLWHHRLMEVPPTAVPPSRQQDKQPLFTLADIGGAGGIRRWLRLRIAFPDAVIATTAMYRRGSTTHAARLLEIAAAIEFYVNACRRDRAKQWAAKTGTASTHGHALARRVGQPFEKLVGDTDVWATRFQKAYNGIKHDPAYLRDPSGVDPVRRTG